MKVLVYGANGGLARMVAGSLRRRKLEVCLGGRQLSRLQGVAGPSEECRVGGPDAVVRGARVVINCAPLSWAETDALVAASLRAGADYLDTSGEQALIGHLLDTYGPEAQSLGRSLIPAVGFDYAVGDCLARLAADGLEPCSEIEVSYAFSQGAVDGSLAFAARRRGRECVYRRGAWRNVPFELDWAVVEFPPPFGRQQVGRYGAGEVISVPRHTRTLSVRTSIVASALVPHPVLLPLFPILRPFVTRAMETRLRYLIHWLARRLRRGSAQPPSRPSFPPIGPAFAVVAVARGRGGSRRWTATGGDCYLASAELIALAAENLLAGKAAPGALSPAAAFEPGSFLEQLQPFVVCATD